MTPNPLFAHDAAQARDAFTLNSLCLAGDRPACPADRAAGRSVRCTQQDRTPSSGAALVLVMVSALIFSIAAFGVLTMAVSRAQQVDYLSEERMRARFAAEAGLVWAAQQLWVNPGGPPGCVPGTDQAAPPWLIDTDGGGPLPATTVNVRVRNCGLDRVHTLEAKVALP